MSESSNNGRNRQRLITRLMLSVDGSLALGETHWLEGGRITFTVRTFLSAGARVKLRLVQQGSNETVDVGVIVELADSTSDWAEFLCVGLIHEMSPTDRQLLERWVRAQGAKA